MNALFVIGSPASGKSTLIKQCPWWESEHIINVDDEYERLLKENGLGLNIAGMTLDELSLTGTLLAEARRKTRSKENLLIQMRQSICFDMTGGSYNNVKDKKEYLESLGYKVGMYFMCVPLYVSLERNSLRERTLVPISVVRSWVSVMKNLEDFKKLFPTMVEIKYNSGENDNPMEEQPYMFNNYHTIIKKYPSSKGKEKSTNQRVKAEQDIITLLDEATKLEMKYACK